MQILGGIHSSRAHVSRGLVEEPHLCHLDLKQIVVDDLRECRGRFALGDSARALGLFGGDCRVVGGLARRGIRGLCGFVLRDAARALGLLCHDRDVLVERRAEELHPGASFLCRHVVGNAARALGFFEPAHLLDACVVRPLGARLALDDDHRALGVIEHVLRD
eukprot:Amastigsp_a348319_22.p3 type:complete len:163 gc:universal Amastigsp_a348319_22:940-452(-)